MTSDTATTTTTETLHGSVERITFHNEDNGFCVIKVKSKGHKELVTMVGKALRIGPGEQVEGFGTWVLDKSYGMQFHCQELRVVPPRTIAGIEKYLGSGMVKGIGPHFAKKLVATFGEEVFDVIENHPERLSELSGIGKKRQERLAKSWHEQKSVRDIMVFLQSHGIGATRSVRIYKTYGDQAVNIIRANPYCLANDIHGVGFKTADELARALGIPADSLVRARAGVRHRLQTLATSGHCAAKAAELATETAELLEIPETIAIDAIHEEHRAENIVQEAIDGQPCYFLTKLHQAECQVADQLHRLQRVGALWADTDIEQAIPWVESRTNMLLSSSQKQAVRKALSSKVCIITGGPGVGKTTLINSILRILRHRHVRVQLCAPTGRAAKRLSESTGLEAKTIHRTLEFDAQSFGFKRNEENPLDTDLLVLDEASMVDISLASQLLAAIPNHAGCLIVGDIDQLPSVGPGAFLSDLIHSNALPVVKLTEIFRQAANSHIIVNAHRINAGKVPETPSTSAKELSDFYFLPCKEPEEITAKLTHLVTERIPHRFGLHPARDIQVLTPMNRSSLGSRTLNQLLQSRLNPNPTTTLQRFGWTFSTGDKVLQTVNNYDKEVFNGDIGFIQHINDDEDQVLIQFEGRDIAYDFHELDEITLAYATTIHKSQGSEYPAVVMPLAMQHYMMLERNLLYTGVTRGRQLVIIIGEKRALTMACKNQRAGERLTNLRARLYQLDEC